MKNLTERIFGFPIKFDWTFFYFFVVYVFIYRNDFDLMGYRLTMLASIYLCVILHELGHVYAAKWLGYPCKQIKMYMIGGVAQIEGDWDQKPKHEFLITIAGPAVNLIIALIIILFYAFNFPMLEEIIKTDKNWTYFFPELAIGNIVLIIFNMLPIFPLDGGRVFRSLLVMITKQHEKSTLFVNYTALILSVALAVFMAYTSQYVTVLICVLIFGSNLIQIITTYKKRKEKKKEEKRKEEMIKNLPKDITILFRERIFISTYIGSFLNQIPENAEIIYENDVFGRSFRYPIRLNRQEVEEFLTTLNYVKVDESVREVSYTSEKYLYSQVIFSRMNI